MKIGITGATGQLGRIVVKLLSEKVASKEIVALVRNPQKANDLGVEAREFDYNQTQNLAKALEGIDKLLIISGNEMGQRVQQHTNIVEAAQKAGVKHIVYTSLLRADSSTLVLAGEHIATENVITNSGITYTLLRNSWYTENYTDFVGGAIANGALVGSSGEGKISSATRADYAQAAVTVLTSEGHENKTYELAGDEAFTMADYAKVISKVVGKTIPYQNIPVEEYAKILAQTGMPEPVAQFFAGTHIATEKGDLFDDSHQLSKLIGRKTTSLEQAIQTALAL